MPLPLLGYGLAVVGGSVIGALLRQPEINRLKKQVRVLHKEIERLQGVIEEQDRQIKELKIRYDTLKAYNFVSRMQHGANLRGWILQQYAFKEYVSISVCKIRGTQIEDEKTIFFNIYLKFLNGQADEVSVAEYQLLKKYLLSRYKLEIKQMLPASLETSIKELEAA
jgi:hypothetical protein